MPLNDLVTDIDGFFTAEFVTYSRERQKEGITKALNRVDREEKGKRL